VLFLSTCYGRGDSSDQLHVEGSVIELPKDPQAAERVISDVLGAGAFGDDDIERALHGVSEALVLSVSWDAAASSTGLYRLYFDVPGRRHVLTGSPSGIDAGVGVDQFDREVFQEQSDIAGYRQHSAEEQVYGWSAKAEQRGTLNVLFIAYQDEDVPLGDPRAVRAAMAYVSNDQLRWVQDVPLQVVPS